MFLQVGTADSKLKSLTVTPGSQFVPWVVGAWDLLAQVRAENEGNVGT